MTPSISRPRISLRNYVPAAVGMFAAVLLAPVLYDHAPLVSLADHSQRPRPAPVRAGLPQDIGKNEGTRQLQQRLLAADSRSREALVLFTALLEDAQQRLEKKSDYSASYVMQERPKDQPLQQPQNIELKVRHAPFSVYMKWLAGENPGREVLYVANQPDSNLLLRMGGPQGRIIPLLRLNPTGALAMKQSRYPVTDMGLRNLALKIINLRKQDLARAAGVHWRLIPNEKCFDRDCVCLIVEYDSPAISAPIRKSLTYIDKELSLPVCVKSFTWPDASSPLNGDQGDDATLIELYGYKDVRFDIGLKDRDFDQSNDEYAFSK